MKDGQWVFGKLIGPVPKFDPQADKNGDCGFGCEYRRNTSTGTEVRSVEFRLREESRLKLNNYASADGVDALLAELVLIEQSNLAQRNWDPGNMAISYEKLKQLYEARERALSDDERDDRELD